MKFILIIIIFIVASCNKSSNLDQLNPTTKGLDSIEEWGESEAIVSFIKETARNFTQEISVITDDFSDASDSNITDTLIISKDSTIDSSAITVDDVLDTLSIKVVNKPVANKPEIKPLTEKKVPSKTPIAKLKPLKKRTPNKKAKKSLKKKDSIKNISPDKVIAMDTNSELLLKLNQLMNTRPESKDELHSFGLRAYNVLKSGFKLFPGKMYDLNERALLYNGDPVFHLFGCMFDFKKGNYNKVLVRVGAGEKKISRFFKQTNRVIQLYKIASNKILFEKYPTEEARLKFANSKNTFLLHYDYKYYQLPKDKRDFDPMAFLNINNRR